MIMLRILIFSLLVLWFPHAMKAASPWLPPPSAADDGPIRSAFSVPPEIEILRGQDYSVLVAWAPISAESSDRAFVAYVKLTESWQRLCYGVQKTAFSLRPKLEEGILVIEVLPWMKGQWERRLRLPLASGVLGSSVARDLSEIRAGFLEPNESVTLNHNEKDVFLIWTPPLGGSRVYVRFATYQREGSGWIPWVSGSVDDAIHIKAQVVGGLLQLEGQRPTADGIWDKQLSFDLH